MKLSIHHIAKGLDLPVSTVDRWIRQGRIPVQKSGQEVSFDADVLKKWAAAHHLPFSLSSGTESKTSASGDGGTLLEAMQRGGIHHRLDADDMTTALWSVVASVPDLSSADRNSLYDALIERERMTSTGIGKGVAIPHPRAPLAELDGLPQIVTGFLERPVPYNAIDDRPVFVLFLLLSTSVKVHLHLLSRLAFCVRDESFLGVLRTAPRAEVLFEKIAAFETDLDRCESVRG